MIDVSSKVMKPDGNFSILSDLVGNKGDQVELAVFDLDFKTVSDSRCSLAGLWRCEALEFQDKLSGESIICSPFSVFATTLGNTPARNLSLKHLIKEWSGENSCLVKIGTRKVSIPVFQFTKPCYIIANKIFIYSEEF